jgi:hypothetical protein
MDFALLSEAIFHRFPRAMGTIKTVGHILACVGKHRARALWITCDDGERRKSDIALCLLPHSKTGALGARCNSHHSPVGTI